VPELRAIGVDPGPIPGLVLLDYDRDPDLVMARRPTRVSVLQHAGGDLPWLLRKLLCDWRRGKPALTIVQTERFVVSGRSGRSSSAKAGEETRDLVGRLEQVTLTYAEDPTDGGAALFVTRPAASVKPWADNVRLHRVGLLEATNGMVHARDAARHALFTACRDGGVPDPLSKR
jgi:hypothetical protein